MDVVLPKPGGYVVAVSGGVDSMALLDILRRQVAGEAGWKLVVAHLDHGIRDDSFEDRKLVQAVAKTYGLPFVYKEIKLGQGASEATARAARYGFLRETLRERGGQAIITAHHQDDVLETAIINLLRGTGRKGLTSLGTGGDLSRPLLRVPKSQLVSYAEGRGLKWREDATNQDLGYLRNYVRQRILPSFEKADRADLVSILTKLTTTNRELDAILNELLGTRAGGALDRQWFNQLSHSAAREMMAAWLRLHGSRGFDSKTLERLVVAAKTAAAGKQFPVQAGLNMKVEADRLALASSER